MLHIVEVCMDTTQETLVLQEFGQFLEFIDHVTAEFGVCLQWDQVG